MSEYQIPKLIYQYKPNVSETSYEKMAGSFNPYNVMLVMLMMTVTLAERCGGLFLCDSGLLGENSLEESIKHSFCENLLQDNC
jgi:hypothetical protein